MSSYRLTPKARRDLTGSQSYLLEEAGVRVTRKVLTAMVEAFEKLSRTPGLGHRREDLTDHDEFRFRTVFSYLVVYRIGSRPLSIVAVVHGKRDMVHLLKSR